MKADNRDISFKKGWEKRRLGDIGKVITGSTPSTKDKDNYSSDDYCFIKPSDIVKNGISNLYDSEFHISQKGFDISRQLPVGSVLTTCIGIVGKVAILYTPAICNQQINAIIPSNIISSKFLAYSILGIRNILETIANAPVVPIINKKDFSNVEIPIPPLNEQERIVSELDLLSGIIDKQKAQLKELDNLAQSIFYDMFGDPNVELRFTPKRIGEISTNLDSKRKPVTKSDRESGQYPYYGASGIVDYVSSYIFDGNYLLISEDGANLLTRTQPIAFISHGKVWVNNHAHVLDFDNFCSKIYLKHYLNLLNFKDKVKGAAQPKLTQKDLNDIKVSWASLTLQNTFATKIENIEKQKETITRSIAETQLLFDSRMDYYFG